jgi:hypothetical protein
MATINQLSATDTLSNGDLLPVYKQDQGDARKSSMTTLLAYMQANLTFPSTGIPDFTKQYAAPSASGFNIAITDSSVWTWLVLTPTTNFAAGTITLPAVANVVDKQEILVNCTQQVTSLTVAGNGAVGVTGAPTSLGADDFFKMKFDALTSTWYRVG